MHLELKKAGLNHYKHFDQFIFCIQTKLYVVISNSIKCNLKVYRLSVGFIFKLGTSNRLINFNATVSRQAWL